MLLLGGPDLELTVKGGLQAVQVRVAKGAPQVARESNQECEHHKFLELRGAARNNPNTVSRRTLGVLLQEPLSSNAGLVRFGVILI
jgi:hypothetical protein